MVYKNKKALIISFICLTVFLICVNVNAQAQEYEISVKVDDEFVWEVTYLDLSLFERILGYEPNFDVEDRIRLVIHDIGDRDTYWMIFAYFWDYNVDWSEEGSSEAIRVFQMPFFYEDSIFLPTPIEDYLADVEEQYPLDYQVEGTTISTILISEADRTYLHEKTYNNRGVLIKESIYQYFPETPPGRLIVRVEAAFVMIPMGITFIGFIILGTLSIIFVIMKRKNYLIKT